MKKRFEKFGISKNFGFWFLGATFLFAACTAGPNRPPMEYMPDMIDSPAIEAQEEGRNLFPENSVSLESLDPIVGDNGEEIKDAKDAGEKLKNPLPLNRETLMLGKQAYENHCYVCHGSRGKGNGPVTPDHPSRSLVNERVSEFKDGYIFHVITYGQNAYEHEDKESGKKTTFLQMGAYAKQVSVEKRWAIVHYIRAMQRAANPNVEDLKSYQQMLKEKASHLDFKEENEEEENKKEE